MAIAGAVRSAWVGDTARAMLRIEDSRSALSALVRRSDAVHELAGAIAAPATRSGRFDAVRELASYGNHGLWVGWDSADQASTLLAGAVRQHPGGAGLVQLQRSHALAEQASGELGHWIATGGSRAGIDVIEQMVRPQLAQARAMARAALGGA